MALWFEKALRRHIDVEQEKIQQQPDILVFSRCMCERALARDVRKEPHKAGTLDSCRQFSLIFSAYPRFLTREHTGMRVKELLQKFRVLVINVFNIVLGKVALLHRIGRVYPILKVCLERNVFRIAIFFGVLNGLQGRLLLTLG